MRDDMTFSIGLGLPVMATPGVGNRPAPRADEKEAAQVFYVVAIRDTQRLVIEDGGGGSRFQHTSSQIARADL